MYEEYYKWFDGFMLQMNENLKEYLPRNDGTGDNERFRRYYVIGNDGKEHFIVHLRPAPTKRRINLLFGLNERHLRLPDGCPPLESRDQSVPNYREFNLNMNDKSVEKVALDLARQVADYHTK